MDLLFQTRMEDTEKTDKRTKNQKNGQRYGRKVSTISKSAIPAKIKCKISGTYGQKNERNGKKMRMKNF